MIRKKICLLGAFSVGKTSLVKRFVSGIFSEKYLTTLGVKIDKKSLCCEGQDIDLILWDLAGEDSFLSVNMSYLKGASGLMFVVDGTRPDTLDTAIELLARLGVEYSALPRVILLNKADLFEQWQLPEKKLSELNAQGDLLMKTSALSGESVEEAFISLSEMMLDVVNG